MALQFKFNEIEILQHDLKLLNLVHERKILELTNKLEFVKKQIPINLKCAQLLTSEKPIIECRFQKKCKSINCKFKHIMNEKFGKCPKCNINTAFKESGKFICTTEKCDFVYTIPLGNCMYGDKCRSYKCIRNHDIKNICNPCDKCGEYNAKRYNKQWQCLNQSCKHNILSIKTD